MKENFEDSYDDLNNFNYEKNNINQTNKIFNFESNNKIQMSDFEINTNILKL